jgi:hypothetical protein
MAQVIVARRGPLAVFERGSDGIAKVVVGNDTANAARYAGQSNDAATRSEDARDEVVTLGASYFRTGTIADRGPTPFQNYPNGFHYFVNDINPPRLFAWVKAGQRNPNGVVAGADGWFSYYTPAEMKNLGIDFTGQLPAANVAGLTAGYADTASLFQVKIAGLRAVAASDEDKPRVDIEWDVKGTMPDSQTLAWGTYSVVLSGAVRRVTVPDWTVPTASLLVIGNSLSDSSQVSTRWSQILAAARKQTLVSTARYSSDARQAYRCGAVSILLTLASPTLPTNASTVAVTQFNGLAPSNNASVNPASFLNTGAGDTTLTVGMSMTGWIGDRHVTVSIPNGASTSYSVRQDAGLVRRRSPIRCCLSQTMRWFWAKPTP